MTVAFIGLGSNMDNPGRHIRSAIASLDSVPLTALIKVSSLYKSKPLGPPEQDDYINAVAKLETTLDVMALLESLQKLEQQHGRIRTGDRWGPRPLDLDILMYGSETICNARLLIPHAEMLKRSFVLVPLYELEPGLRIPGNGWLKDHIDNIAPDGLEKL